MPTFTGDEADNFFNGGAEDDLIVGNGGNDTLSGGGGNDKIVGNEGSDTLSGGDGDDQIYSYNIDPVFPGFLSPGISYDIFAEVDTLSGGAGDDYMFAGYGDFVDGGTPGSFGDRLFISFLGSPTGVQADFRILQAQGSITIGGGTIRNIQNIGYLEGSNFDDLLVPIDTYYPSGGSVYGRGGNDHLIANYYGGRGGSGLYGGDGDDIVDARPSQYGAAAYGDAGNDTIYAAYNGSSAFGGDGDDTIYGSATVHGGSGNDIVVMSDSYYGTIVHGDDGDDHITAGNSGGVFVGGTGADVIIGGTGVDRLSSAGYLNGAFVDDLTAERDQLGGGGGADALAIGYGDSADGGAGSDTLRLVLAGHGSGITFSTAGIASGQPFTFAGGTIENIETLDFLRATDFADILTLATQASLLTVDAGAGDDLVISQNSSVSVNGGAGDDIFTSGAAGDIWDGGAGSDTINYRNSSAIAGVTVTLAAVAGQAAAGPGGDRLTNIENIVGSSYDDTLTGNGEANVLRGDWGRDTLRGLGGNDLLYGEDHADAIYGGDGSDTALGGDGDDLVNGDNGDDTLYGDSGNDTLSGGSGADALVGGTGNDLLDGGTGNDGLFGGTGNDQFFVDSASDRILETAGEGYDIAVATVSFALEAGSNVEELRTSDAAGRAALNLTGNEIGQLIVGNAGANVLNGGGGDDVLDGGDGLDTALYSGLFRSYVVDRDGATRSVSGDSGNDTLTSIEFIQFKDGTFVFDADGVAAQVTRLYDTVLQRGPDQVGLDYYVDRIEDHGGTLKQIASGFLNSPEFGARIGTLSNADYVEFLYQNALGRASDPGGKAAWVQHLDSGAGDRADLLIGFSESLEHRGLTAGLVAQGFFNTDDDYQAVALLYDTFAGRRPDAAGLEYYVGLLKSGALTLDQIADNFAASPEFRALTDGMSNTQLINFMYLNTLDRPAEEAGLIYWNDRLNAGIDRGDLLLGFSQSIEHFVLLGEHVTNGIDFL